MRWEGSFHLAVAMRLIASDATCRLLLARSLLSFIEPFNTVSMVASTVPGNGDVNPYGVAAVPSTIGSLV